MGHFVGEFNLDFVKEVLVTGLFPSEEDGNPDDYVISINYATNSIILEKN